MQPFDTERIAAMEAIFDEGERAVAAFWDALERYLAAQENIRTLAGYYESDAWRADFEADEQGLLPVDLKRGVLSEDGVYNLLTDNDAAKEELRAAAGLTANDYQTRALRTLNPALSPRDVLINGVMGLCGESGEAIDLVKKHLAQGHPLDREKLIGELGDVAWYLAETASAVGCDLETVLKGNLDKLQKRYPDGFDAERSEHRAPDA